MTVRIYTSPDPAPFLPQQSVFQYLLPDSPELSPLPSFDSSLPAFIDGKTGETLSRGDVKSIALRLAAALRGAELGGEGEGLGLKFGDTACIWSFNSLEWALTAYGLLAAGVTISPANAAYTVDELAHQVNNSGATIMFLSLEHVPAFEKARPLLKRSFPDSRVILLCKASNRPAVLARYRTLEEVLAPRPGVEQRLDGSMAQTTAWLCYSSGTTGLPKGVMTSHMNMTSQVQANNVSFTKLTPKDVMLCFLPFSHIYAVTIALMLPMSMGTPVVVLPRFDEIQVLNAVQKYKVTTLLLVPPVTIVLLNSPNVAKYDLSTVKTVMCGAAPLSTELLKAFLARVFPQAVIVQGFGMTETSPNLATFPRELAAGHEGLVGRLMPTYQARLVLEDGTDAPEGGPGELWVRGPSVMKGYHANVQATLDTIAPGGWMKTGDIVSINPEGWFSVVDRKKELIKYKGFQVAPAELEGLLIQHPRVLDAGVVGINDDSQATELPRAYIVPADSGSAAELAAEIIAWVATKAASHKHLRGGIVVVEAIPKSPSGKILRKNLRIRANEDKDTVYGYKKAKL